jgi:hypothetical protein
MGDDAMARIYDGADEGAKTLDEVKAFLHRFVVISDSQSTATALLRSAFALRRVQVIPARECDEGGVRNQYSPADSSVGKSFRRNQVVDAAQAQREQCCCITL